MTDNTLEDRLENYPIWCDCSESECQSSLNYKQVFIQIEADLLGIIGEDEPYPAELFKRTEEDVPKYFRNKVRQDLRDKVKEYCK